MATCPDDYNNKMEMVLDTARACDENGLEAGLAKCILMGYKLQKAAELLTVDYVGTGDYENLRGFKQALQEYQTPEVPTSHESGAFDAAVAESKEKCALCIGQYVQLQEGLLKMAAQDVFGHESWPWTWRREFGVVDTRMFRLVSSPLTCRRDFDDEGSY